MHVDQSRPAVIPIDVFGISAVQHQNSLLGDPHGQTLNLAQANHGAGRVVWVSDEHKPGFIGASGQ